MSITGTKEQYELALGKKQTMKYTLLMAFDESSSSEEIKETMLFVDTRYTNIQSAIDSMTKYNKPIHVYENTSIFKLINKPQFKEYVYTKDNELIPK